MSFASVNTDTKINFKLLPNLRISTLSSVASLCSYFEMKEVFFRVVGDRPALFTHIQFASSLFELITELFAMYFLTMRL